MVNILCYNQVMNIRWVHIFGVITIVAIVFSVVACAYISTDMAGMNHMDIVNVTVDHTEHASSLTRAVVPSILISLVLLCFSLIFFLQDYLLVSKKSFSFALIQSIDSSQQKLRRYFFNLRSPPAYQFAR